MDESIDNSWDDLIDVLATEDVEIPGSPPSFSANSVSMLDTDPIGRKRSDSHLSKKRKANPDADDIAKATEEALMQLGLDPNSEEFKLKKRQIRNRISAQSHRDRKNSHISVLENEISSKNQRITELELEVQTLKQENERLRCLLLRNDVSRTSSDLTARTDIETRYSVASSSPVHMMGGSGSGSGSSCANSTLGSQTPDYSVSSASSASYALPATMDVQNHVPLALTGTVSSQSSLSASNPILKSLSFICVICVLCLCSNMSGNATVGTSNGTLSSPSQPVDDHALSSAHRRLLSIEYDATNHSLPVISHELSSMSLGNGTALSLLSSAVEGFAGTQQYKSANESHKNNHNLRRRQLHVPRTRDHRATANDSATKTPADIEQWLQSLPPELLAALWTGSASASSNRLLLPSTNVDGGGKAPVAIHSLHKDLLPFPITQGPHEDWFSYQHRIQALSTSHVFLHDGIALFDPGFQPTEAWATALLTHYQQTQQQQPQQRQQSQQQSSPRRDVSSTTGGPVSIARSASSSVSSSAVDDKDLFLPAPVHDAMDVDEEDERVLDALPSPDVALLPAPVAAPLKHPGGDVAAQSSSMDLVVPRLVGARSGRLLAADAVADTPRVLKLSAMDTASASAAAARLIAESNMVTLTIPATAIKVGRSLQDSEDSSMDSLLRLFNLTSTATSNSPTGGINHNGSSSSFGTSSGAANLQNAWVEMNCIVVGAKVTWQQASAGAAEQRH